jgi:hypothetical protein
MEDTDRHGIEAIAHASLSLTQGILQALVKHKVMTVAEVKALVLEAARQQQSLYDQAGVLSPANEYAAKILEELANLVAAP